jgi:hypothetical protein
MNNFFMVFVISLPTKRDIYYLQYNKKSKILDGKPSSIFPKLGSIRLLQHTKIYTFVDTISKYVHIKLIKTGPLGIIFRY